ncbi:MAG: hypothetical protein H5T50_09225 [Nitrososphaeria archaeon]|nr:hypothetical protein [Nitrososphaeria archaeon]
MLVILSIKPKYCKKIIAGEKRYEFRKRFPKNIELVYMYATSPVKKVVGEFKVGEVVEDEPIILWRKFRTYAGVDKNEFFKYYEGCNKGCAIKIEEVRTFAPIDPKIIVSGFKPPQSYRYTNIPFFNISFGINKSMHSF